MVEGVLSVVPGLMHGESRTAPTRPPPGPGVGPPSSPSRNCSTSRGRVDLSAAALFQVTMTTESRGLLTRREASCKGKRGRAAISETIWKRCANAA
jgi:hypothetical protein